MPEFEIRFRVDGPSEYDQGLVDLFYSSFDGLIAWHDAQLYMVFAFDAVNGELNARHLADRAEEVMDVHILEADFDLVDIPEIASRTGRSRQNIQQLVTGKRRMLHADFPSAFSVLGNKRIWDWGSVVEWLRFESILDDDEPRRLTRQQLYSLNYWLSRRVILSHASHRKVGPVNSAGLAGAIMYSAPSPSTAIAVDGSGGRVGKVAASAVRSGRSKSYSANLVREGNSTIRAVKA